MCLVEQYEYAFWSNVGQFAPLLCNDQLSVEFPEAFGCFDGIGDLFGPDELIIVTAVCLFGKQMPAVKILFCNPPRIRVHHKSKIRHWI